MLLAHHLRATRKPFSQSYSYLGVSAREVGGCCLRRAQGSPGETKSDPVHSRYRAVITAFVPVKVSSRENSMVTTEPDRGKSTATPLNVNYRVDRISSYLSGRWLDYGCATGGYNAEMLSKGVETLVGVDVEEDRIEEAKRRGLPNAEYTLYDGHTLPFGAATFDGVLMNEVFEHVPNEAMALAEVHRVLKPGGVLVLISPNRWFPVEGHNVHIGSKVFCPAPLIPWLPERLTRNWTRARNYWPRQLVRHVVAGGFAIRETGFIWPVLEFYPWLPPRGVKWYQRHFRTWDRVPGLRRFGVSTMVIGIKAAA